MSSNVELHVKLNMIVIRYLVWCAHLREGLQGRRRDEAALSAPPLRSPDDGRNIRFSRYVNGTYGRLAAHQSP